MRVRTITQALVLAVACGLASNTYARSWEQTPRTNTEASSTSILLGYKQLAGSDWEPAEDQYSIGIDYSHKPSGWPVGVTSRFLANYGTGTVKDIKAQSLGLEIHVGGTKTFYSESFWRFRPYLAAGAALALAQTEMKDAGAKRSAVGYGGGLWAGGGFHFQLSEALSAGLDSRWSYIPMNLSGDSVEFGGLFLGISLGYHWYGH